MKKGASVLLVVFISFLLSAGWWRLWMYYEFIGPVPIVGLLSTGDGEGSYDIVLLDMFINIVLVVFSLRVFRKRKLI